MRVRALAFRRTDAALPVAVERDAVKLHAMVD
jgi:hypothetical protein